MSLNKQFLIDLETVLTIPQTQPDERWQKFLHIIGEYQVTKNISLGSIGDFDNIHSQLLDFLLPKNENNAPLLDHSEFKKFEKIMMQLRRTIESLVIENYFTRGRLNALEIKMSDLQAIIFETEFKKLSYEISTPLKNMLSKRFRQEMIRIDPLDESLIDVLLNKHDNIQWISQNSLARIIHIYKEIANAMGIADYQQLVEVIVYRRQRNSEQYDLIHDYIKRRRKYKLKPDFLDLLQELKLNGLREYKAPEMKTLEKVFNFYLDEYH